MSIMGHGVCRNSYCNSFVKCPYGFETHLSVSRHFVVRCVFEFDSVYTRLWMTGSHLACR